MSASKLAALATEALLAELAATPKPGLVDRANSGAHHDMDYNSFLASAAALHPYFEEIASAAAKQAHLSPQALLACLRPIGVEAEAAMFRATKGINTHKGALFSMGLCLAAAAALAASGKRCEAATVCDFVSQMAGALPEELSKGPADTSGKRQFQALGLTGARGEAQSGFETVRTHALPHLAGYAAAAPDAQNAKLVTALLSLMAHTADSNILSRGGEAGATLVQTGARHALALGGFLEEAGRRATFDLDQTLITAHLSPGGSADLLAVAVFLHMLEPIE